MKDIANHLVRTLRAERENFVWMDFNDRATGDAFYLVVITTFLSFVGLAGIGIVRAFVSFDLAPFMIRFLLSGVIEWLIIAGITYAIVKFLMQENHNFPAILRFTGYAFPTRLLVVFFGRFVDSLLLVFVLGSAWLVYLVAKGIVATSELTLEKALIASAGGVVGASIVASILLV